MTGTSKTARSCPESKPIGWKVCQDGRLNPSPDAADELRSGALPLSPAAKLVASSGRDRRANKGGTAEETLFRPLPDERGFLFFGDKGGDVHAGRNENRIYRGRGDGGSDHSGTFG
jgi:hypothetical protein